MALDGLEFAATLTVTSSGVAQAYGFRALTFLVVNDGTTTSWIDFTQGATITAATSLSTSFPLKSGETLTRTARDNAYYTGLSAIQASGSTSATLRVLASR